MLRYLALILLLLLIGCGPTRVETIPDAPKHEPAITVSVTPKVAPSSNTSVMLVIRIAEHPDNRMLKVMLDGPNYYRSSIEDWTDGAVLPPHILTVRFDNVLEGHYVASVALIRAGGQILMAHDTMCVTGPFTTCGEDR